MASLTQEMGKKRERLDFARRHDIELSPSRKKVLFSNEIQLLVPRHIHSRQLLGTHFDKQYDEATMKHLPRQMILGSPSYRGAAGLISLCLTPL